MKFDAGTIYFTIVEAFIVCEIIVIYLSISHNSAGVVSIRRRRKAS